MKTMQQYAWIAGLFLIASGIHACENQQKYTSTAKPEAFLQQQSLIATDDRLPLVFYLTDDRTKHLEDLKKTIDRYSPEIKFTPVLCTYLEGKKNHDSLTTDRQLMNVLIYYKDTLEIKNLIDNDPYTKQMVSDCLLVLLDKAEECLSIFNNNSGIK